MNETKRRRILIVVFGFPPRAGSGVQRIVNFTRYLPENNWQPTILTLSRWGNEIEDRDLERIIPAEVPVHRVFSLDPMRIRIALRNMLRKGKNGDSIKSGNGKSGIVSAVISRIYQALSIPDHSIWWAPTAVLAGIFLVIKYRPHLIFTTSGPYGTAVIGLILHKLTGKPWVAEFRDPWIGNASRPLPPLRLKVEKLLARSCFCSTRGLIGAVDLALEEFKRLKGRDFQVKYITLTNGFNIEDFRGEHFEKRKNEKFHLIYTGMFYGTQKPDSLFSALKEACRMEEGFKLEAKVILAGSMQAEYLTWLKEAPWKDIVEYRGYVSHRRVLELLALADLLYLYIPSGEIYSFSAKVFEYLAAQRPILAAVPKGGLAEKIITRFKAGMIVEPDDVQTTARSIINCYRKFKAGDLAVSHTLKEVEEYSWNSIVSRLSKFLGSAISGSANEE
jgi:glycosyltransferase involved in cell wall biosynthesis